MRELIDCHVHTERCGHAVGTVAQMVHAGAANGLSAMIMTEHLPLPAGLDPQGCYAMLDGAEVAEYITEVRRAASEVAPGLTVVVGGEADWIPSRTEETRAVRAAARDAGVDVLLGSVHFLEDWAFDDPDLIAEWDSRDIATVWEQYFGIWCAAASSGEFEIMAHPDLVKKCGHRPGKDVRGLYDAAAAAAASSGVAIEVSTAGLRKPVGELYPGADLLAAFCRAGVPVAVGSDAHAPSEVGMDIEVAYRACVEAGYTEVVVPLGVGEVRRVAL